MAIDGNRIRQLRKDIGLTQEALGKKLGVIKQTVSSWENNISEPNSETLSNMASIFGVTTDYLLDNNLSTVTQSKEPTTFLFFFDSVHRKIFANRIRAALADIGLTENEFVELVSIGSKKASSFLAEESDPSADDLIEISQFCETSIDYLLGQIPKVNYAEKKILNTFIKLDKDNQDIIIGKAKELLKEQEHKSVAADSKLRKTGTTNSEK